MACIPWWCGGSFGDMPPRMGLLEPLIIFGMKPPRATQLQSYLVQKCRNRKEPRILPSGLRCALSSLRWLSGLEAKMKRSTVVTLTLWVPSPKIEHPISCGIHSFDAYREINTQGPRAGNILNLPIPASQEMPIVQLLFIHHFIS